MRRVVRVVPQGVWSYIVGSLCTPTFIIVPMVTIWFGVFPIVLNFWASLGLTVYYLATTALRAPTHRYRSPRIPVIAPVTAHAPSC